MVLNTTIPTFRGNEVTRQNNKPHAGLQIYLEKESPDRPPPFLALALPSARFTFFKDIIIDTD
jgi:hypothetical protein